MFLGFFFKGNIFCVVCWRKASQIKVFIYWTFKIVIYFILLLYLLQKDLFHFHTWGEVAVSRPFTWDSHHHYGKSPFLTKKSIRFVCWVCWTTKVFVSHFLITEQVRVEVVGYILCKLFPRFKCTVYSMYHKSADFSSHC